MRVRRYGRGWVLAALLVLGAEAAAQSPADAVVEQLREQGYVEFEVSRTLLRRIRVVALMPDGSWREIVFNPATGEILRDYYEAADGSSTPMILDRSDDDAQIGRARTTDETGGRDDEVSSPRGDGQAAPSRSEDDRPGRSGGEGAGSRGTEQAAGARSGVGP